MNMNNEENLDRDMTVDIQIDENTWVSCKVDTILTVDGKDYIALIHTLDNSEEEVWFYGYSENLDNPNEEPELINITDDEEYEAVADAYDEFLDNCDFDEM